MTTTPFCLIRTAKPHPPCGAKDCACWCHTHPDPTGAGSAETPGKLR